MSGIPVQRTLHTMFLAFSLGVVAVIAQTVLLREFLGVTDGNELVLGLVLATWMILTGAGAFLGRRQADHPRSLEGKLLFLGVLPLLGVALLRLVRGLLVPAGAMPGLPETLLIAVLVLSPFCLLAGYLFVLLARVISTSGGSTASAYGWEAAGSVAGGIAGYLLTGSVFNNVQILSGVTLLCAAMWTAAPLLSESKETIRRRVASRAVAVFLPALGAMFLSGTIDSASRGLLYGGSNILFAQDTPYGSLVVSEQAGERSVFENGVLLASTGDLAGREESAHFAMTQRALPGRVLVVSGAAGGILEEVLKYPVARVDYIDLNPGIRAATPYLRPHPEDPRIIHAIGDVREFLRSTGEKYDVLLVNTPDPSTAQANRLFTVEFLRLAKRRMTDSAVLSMSVLPTVEYYGGGARLLASSVHATLRAVFPRATVIPGGRNYFLASSGPIDAGIARLVELRGIPTIAVNRFYIDDALLLERSRKFAGALDSLAPVNTDLHPVVYFRQVAFWLESVNLSVNVVGWTAALLGLAGLVLVSRTSRGVYAAGFAASGIEVIVLLGYQCLYGFVYRSLWLVISAFMGGLAAGALISTRIAAGHSRKWFLVGLLSLGGCGILVALLLEALAGSMGGGPGGIVALLGLVGAAGVATGVVFGAGTKIDRGTPGSIAGSLYAADLVGSAFGSFLAAVFLVPVLGTGTAAWIVGIPPLAAFGLALRSGTAGNPEEA